MAVLPRLLLPLALAALQSHPAAAAPDATVSPDWSAITCRSRTQPTIQVPSLPQKKTKSRH